MAKKPKMSLFLCFMWRYSFAKFLCLHLLPVLARYFFLFMVAQRVFKSNTAAVRLTRRGQLSPSPRRAGARNRVSRKGRTWWLPMERYPRVAPHRATCVARNRHLQPRINIPPAEISARRGVRPRR
jgi:hypothetical protein